MKRVILILLLTTTPAFAAPITLTWDATPDNPTGYHIYARQGVNYGEPIWTGPETTCTVETPDDQQTAFVATAYQIGNIDGKVIESAYSNEVVVTPAGMKPEAPKTLRQIIIEALRRLFDRYFG